LLVELIFALILTLELVPGDAGEYRIDVLENAALSMEISTEREADVARFRNADGQEVLVAERAVTAGHVYTAFPSEGPPSVFDVGGALDALRPFETSPQQTIRLAPGADGSEIEWTVARRQGMVYLGIPSAGIVLVVRSDAIETGASADMGL
jgi:hypothetical protein